MASVVAKGLHNNTFSTPTRAYSAVHREGADLYSLDALIGMNRRSQFAIYLFILSSLIINHKENKRNNGGKKGRDGQGTV